MATTIDRSSLPQEFQDLTSERMLRAPEPQYFHAALLKGVIAAQALSMANSLGLALPGREPLASGIDAPASAFAGLVLNDPSGIFEAVSYFDDFDRAGGAMNPGHSVRINRPIFTDSTYTLTSRTIPVGSTIATTGQAVQMGQVDLVLRRIGGPYASSAVTPYVLERFDMMRSIHGAANVVGRFLQRDCDKTLDKIGIDLFDQVDSTNGTVRPDGMSTDDSSAAAGTFPLDYATIAKLKTRMVTQHVMPFRNGRFGLVLHPRQIEQLKNQADFQRLSQFHRDINPLFTASYQFTIDGFDVYQSTTLTTATNANSITVYRGQAFGRDVVGIGCPRKPEVVQHSSDNYGESYPLVWLAYLAVTTLDSRYTYRVTTD
jgi:hypothetical protein